MTSKVHNGVLVPEDLHDASTAELDAYAERVKAENGALVRAYFELEDAAAAQGLTTEQLEVRQASRLTRILAICNEYGYETIEAADMASIIDRDVVTDGRYLLVEENLGSASDTQPCWLSAHDSFDAAAAYHLGQEYREEWNALYLLDLDTGQKYTPEITMTFVAEVIA